MKFQVKHFWKAFVARIAQVVMVDSANSTVLVMVTVGARVQLSRNQWAPTGLSGSGERLDNDHYWAAVALW